MDWETSAYTGELLFREDGQACLIRRPGLRNDRLHLCKLLCVDWQSELCGVSGPGRHRHNFVILVNV